MGDIPFFLPLAAPHGSDPEPCGTATLSPIAPVRTAFERPLHEAVQQRPAPHRGPGAKATAKDTEPRRSGSGQRAYIEPYATPSWLDPGAPLLTSSTPLSSRLRAGVKIQDALDCVTGSTGMARKYFSSTSSCKVAGNRPLSAWNWSITTRNIRRFSCSATSLDLPSDPKYCGNAIVNSKASTDITTSISISVKPLEILMPASDHRPYH